MPFALHQLNVNNVWINIIIAGIKFTSSFYFIKHLDCTIVCIFFEKAWVYLISFMKINEFFLQLEFSLIKINASGLRERTENVKCGGSYIAGTEYQSPT